MKVRTWRLYETSGTAVSLTDKNVGTQNSNTPSSSLLITKKLHTSSSGYNLCTELCLFCFPDSVQEVFSSNFVDAWSSLIGPSTGVMCDEKFDQSSLCLLTIEHDWYWVLELMPINIYVCTYSNRGRIFDSFFTLNFIVQNVISELKQ